MPCSPYFLARRPGGGVTELGTHEQGLVDRRGRSGPRRHLSIPFLCFPWVTL
jgi:hypothetical protein